MWKGNFGVSRALCSRSFDPCCPHVVAGYSVVFVFDRTEHVLKFPDRVGKTSNWFALREVRCVCKNGFDTEATLNLKIPLVAVFSGRLVW